MAPEPVRVLYSFLRMPALVTGFAVELRERLGWEPVYCFTEPETDALVAETFPDAVRHPWADASRGIPPKGLEELPLTPLSAADLAAAVPWEGFALEIIDRWILLDAWGQQERRAFHFRLLAWAVAVVDRFGIELLVLPAAPHRVADVALYIACRIRGIGVRVASVTAFNGRYIVLHELDAPPAGLDAAISRFEDVEDAALPIGAVERATIEATTTVDTFKAPWFMVDQSKRALEQREIYAVAEYVVAHDLAEWCDARFGAPVDVPLRHLIALSRLAPGGLRDTLRAARARLRSRSRAGSVSAFGRGPGSTKSGSPMFFAPDRGLLEAAPSNGETARYRDWALVFKTRLKRRYEALCEPLSDDLAATPFVYFPLHYQPERTTVPDGGVFGDQFLAASIVANALPDGWRLLIKEHPLTFDWAMLGEKGRWEGFYERFLQLPNTSLVPLEVPTQRLLGASRAVATVTGTAGWEALQMGKPALAFGNAWWALCNGAYRVGSVAEARAALVADPPTRHDVLVFAAAFESVSEHTYALKRYAGAAADLSEDEASAAMVDLFCGAEARIRALGASDRSRP